MASCGWKGKSHGPWASPDGSPGPIKSTYYAGQSGNVEMRRASTINLLKAPLKLFHMLVRLCPFGQVIWP